MFGHQDDHHDDHQHDDAFVPESTTDAAFTADMSSDQAASASDDHPTTDTVNPALPTDTSMFDAAQPANDTHWSPSDSTPSDSPSEDATTGDVPATPASEGSSDLLDIKTQALQQLSPLVGHLDQSPEEKFRTTMMMIQANDDQSLVKAAYEAAQQITDEKAKAQALLDIVNEINYFTHQGSDKQ
jgi:hypothetical protein